MFSSQDFIDCIKNLNYKRARQIILFINLNDPKIFNNILSNIAIYKIACMHNIKEPKHKSYLKQLYKILDLILLHPNFTINTLNIKTHFGNILLFTLLHIRKKYLKKFIDRGLWFTNIKSKNIQRYRFAVSHKYSRFLNQHFCHDLTKYIIQFT